MILALDVRSGPTTICCLSFPALRAVVTNGFFRGLCSGLGLLDIWIGFWEAIHYHEHQ